MATDPGLERVQRWMQACIVQTGTAEEAIFSDDAQAEIPAELARGMVIPSKTLSALERLDIYRGMYLVRMEEALAIDYPGLKDFLGDQGFAQVVARYVEVYPSRSYTLNRLGDHLPEFLATCSNLPKRDFCVELARLEYALTMVFDARETPPLRPETVQAVPPDAWETVRLQPIEGFRLMAFDYPVSRYLGAVDSENRFPRIVRKKTWVVVYRRNYVLHRMDLSEASYELLAALAADHTIGEAITAVMTRKRHPAVKEAQLFNWFREWMAEGLFQALILSDK